MTTETVKFNVGGHKYEVARSLIKQYPNTMLARLISEEWQQQRSDNDELFIERDGERFRYVLDHFRDQMIILPLTIPKAAILEELKYYGIEDAGDDAIDECATNAPQVQKSMRVFSEEEKKLDEIINSLKERLAVAVTAKICIRTFKNQVSGNEDGEYQLRESQVQANMPGDHYFRNIDLSMCNKYLERCGLLATGSGYSSNSYNLNFKVLDGEGS